MNREITDPILNAFSAVVVQSSAPDDTNIALAVNFKLGDLRRLLRNRDHMDGVTKPALAGPIMSDAERARIQHHEFMGGDATGNDDVA